jgi:ATP phosphoribosyltransferase regulatory subunit
MTLHRLAQVPRGVQCFVGDEARRRRSIERRIVEVFEGWDYEEIIPPLYDYAEVFSDPDLRPRTLSFVGREGDVLALRSDFTSLLAKIAAGRLSQRSAPMRLYYSGEVLRDEAPGAGRQSELHQMGLEHLGGDRCAADAEVVAIAAECMDGLDLADWVIAIGHIGVFTRLVESMEVDPESQEALRERVDAKDPAGVRELLDARGVSADLARAIGALMQQAGQRMQVLPALEQALAVCPPAQVALGELRELVSALEAAGLGERLLIDLAEVRGLGYYTGVVFRAYAPGLGYDIGRGGRYDSLLGRFGREMPAVGFMFGLDHLASLLDESDAAPAEAEAVRAHELGTALREARERRTQGTRVRMDDGANR